MKQLYTLKTTIANPDYDKRCRYGQRSIPEFKAGKTFVHQLLAAVFFAACVFVPFFLWSF